MAEGRKRRLELKDALEAVGDLGPFQFLIFALLFVVGAFHGARMTSGYYFLYEQEHRCAPPPAPNATNSQPKLYAIWADKNASDDSCYISNATDNDYTESFDRNPSLIPCPNGWVYDKSVMKWTATAEYNLVCDKKMYRSHANTALMLGSLLGGIIFGQISDRFGRRVSFHCAVIVFVSFGIGMAWASNFYIFVVMYAITGTASTGLFQASLVTAIEFVVPKNRKIPGLLINTFFPIGECILTGVAFAFRDWRWVAVTISAPAILLLSYYWVVPESIRWLMLNKQYLKIEEVLKRMANINGRAVPRDDDDYDNEDFAELLESYDEENREEQEIQQRDSFFHMFKYCILTRRVLFSYVNWMVVNLAYFGLVYNSKDLGQGIFMNFFLGAIVEAPAHILSVLLVDRIGRRYIHCFYFMLITVASAISIVVSLQLEGVTWVLLLMTMVGKFGAAGATGTSYLWMTELYPTSVRSMGLGFGMASARVGAIISAYVIESSRNLNSSFGTALPYIVFCVTGAFTFVLCLFLPETSGRDLPDTVEEARYFGRNPERQNVQEEVIRRDYGAHGYTPLVQA